MKNGLLVFLISIIVVGLVVGAFFVGLNVDLGARVETTVSSAENDSTATTDFAEDYYEETDAQAYEPQGFAQMGRFDSIVRINGDYYYDELNNEGSITVTNHVDQGYYLEHPYAVNLDIHAAYGIGLNYEHFCTFDSDDKSSFNFADDYTLILTDDDDETKLIVEDVLVVTDTGTIFKGYIDRFGYDKDEYDLYFFATSYSEFISLYTEDCGEAVYYPVTGAFSHLESKRIYF